jgi:hypothetical protein
MAITLLTGAKFSVGSSDCAGMNSVIASLANQQQRTTAEQEDTAPLTSRDKAVNQATALQDFIDFLRLYCQPGLGCIHTRIEWYLAHGRLDHPPELILPCNDKCFVCLGGYEKYFLPIIHKEAVRF